MRNICLTLLATLALLLGGCAASGSSSGFSSRKNLPDVLTTPAGPFSGALPLEGSFNPTRTPAVSTVSLPGSQFWDQASNVTALAPNADFQPDGSAVTYAIWRFAGTPQDSLGTVTVGLASADPGATYWVGVADYAANRWEWVGGSDSGADTSIQVNGASGQHSSPSGYIYVAVAAEGASPFAVESVSIEYLERFDISGTVLDMAGRPLAGALVTTNLLDPASVLSAADGSFALQGIPAGTWAVMATLDGYEFTPSAEMVTVTNANLTGIELRGSPKTSGFVASDVHEPNNTFRNSTIITDPLPLQGSISILDDEDDYYGINVPAEGYYYFQMLADESVLYPTLRLYVDQNVDAAYSAFDVVGGATWVGYYFPRNGRYYIDVSCEAGGGNYEISLHQGETRSLTMTLHDNGQAGDGDDGISEELYNTRVELESADFNCIVSTSGTGTIRVTNIPMAQVTVRPGDPLYTFEPLEAVVDMTLGDVNDLDFNFSATAPVDAAEPNNDQATATALVLPLAAPVEGWIGGEGLTDDDDYDFYSFDVPEGKYLMARVRFPLHSASEYSSSGYLDLYDANGDSITMDDTSDKGLEVRSYDPLPAGNYALSIFMEGNLLPYELEVYAYDARFLSASYNLNGNPIDDVRLYYQTADQGFIDYDGADDGVSEVNFPFMPGERVYVYHSRFGMAFDPPYEWVEFGDSDVQLSPTLSYSNDSLEPNDLSAAPQAVSLPMDINASLSSDTDYYDVYAFDVAAPGTLQINLTLDPATAKVSSTFTSDAVAGTLLVHNSSGSDSFYFRADVPGEYRISLHYDEIVEARYQLEVAAVATPVYRISGALDNGVSIEPNYDTCLVNHTSGHSLDQLGTTYLLGYYPDGDYDIEWQIANRTVTPSGTVTVHVNGADEVLDFSAVYLNQDPYEPNDFPSDATGITLPAALNATFDGSKVGQNPSYDSSDYYEFVAPSDGLLEVTVKPQADSPFFYKVTLSEGNWSSYVNYGKLSPNGSRRMLRYNITAGETYILRVECSDDLSYELNADYVP